jgi:hypothetical protein
MGLREREYMQPTDPEPEWTPPPRRPWVTAVAIVLVLLFFLPFLLSLF